MFNTGKLKWFSLTLFVLLNLYIWSQILSFSLKNDLKVVFLDVGQGDAILIETKSGNQVLIDGGPNDQVLRELSKFMPFSDKSIDMIIATHPDSDHIGGLVSVIRRFQNEIYLESGAKSDTFVYRSLENALQESEPERIIARKGMIFDLGDNVILKILFPDRDASGLESNTASIVAQIEYDQTTFMLTGDSPVSIEKYLASIFGSRLKSDVLKAGHHGSKTSSSEVFLGFASPTFAVISAGEKNRYGHPHKEVIERFQNLETEILSTAKLGSIIFVSDGKVVRLR